jgi:hypothetical protein
VQGLGQAGAPQPALSGALQDSQDYYNAFQDYHNALIHTLVPLLGRG